VRPFIGVIVNGHYLSGQTAAENDFGTAYTDAATCRATGQNLNWASGRHAHGEHAGAGLSAAVDSGYTNNSPGGVLCQRLLHFK